MPSRWLAAALLLAPLSAQALPGGLPSRDPQVAAPAGTASLAGTVTIMVSGQASPVRRARVILQAGDGATSTTDTDTSGLFRFGQLAGGTYHVVVDKPGFVPIGRAAPIDIRNAQAARTSIAMQKGAAIEGRLVSDDGQPAMGLTVSAVRLGFGPYGKKVLAMRQTTTDDLGRFRLHTLLPGDYYIEAAPDSLRPPIGSATRSKPTRTYYPGTSRLNEARIVSVGAEQQLTSLDFTLTSAVLATVSGHVTTSESKTPVSFAARLQRVGAPAGEVRCLSIPEGGSFQCPNVPPGDFWLLATSRSGPQAAVEYSITRLTVESRDVVSLLLTTSPGTPVSGRVEIDGGGPLPANLQVSALETEYELPQPGGGSAPAPAATVGPDGAFSFASVAGPRLVRVNRLPTGWALKSVWLDDAEISDAPTPLGAPERPRSVRVVLAPSTGSVGGAVVNAARQPAAGAEVVVFSDDPTHWGARSRFIQKGEVGPSGQYLIAGLLPGKYCVAIVDPLDEGAWEDPDVLARLKPTAKSIVVTGAERLTLDWRLQ